MNDFSMEQKTVLALLRASIWESKEDIFPEVDWKAVDAVAKAQGVIPLVYNGTIAAKSDIPAELASKWKKATVYGVLKNERLMAAQDQVVDSFAKDRIPVVILKGSSVSRYYPTPDLRTLGDIDILVAPEYVQKAIEVLRRLGYEMREADHDFHYGFVRKDAYVELHYDVTTLPDSIAGVRTKQKTEQFLSNTVAAHISGHVFPVLTDENQALSLLLHMVRHMYETGIGLRQMCDWMMFVNNTDVTVFEHTILPTLKRCGLLQYAKVATAVCVKYLGLSAQKVSWREVDDDLVDAFLDSVFSGGNMGKAEGNTFSSLFTVANKMGTQQSAFKAMLANLNTISAENFPRANRCVFLRPFLWLFLVLRYVARSLLGKRKKIVVSDVVKGAKKHRDLHEKLNPFGIEE